MAMWGIHVLYKVGLPQLLVAMNDLDRKKLILSKVHPHKITVDDYGHQ